MKKITLLILFSLLGLTVALAGPLDNKELTIIDAEDDFKKYTNTVKCLNSSQMLSECENISFTVKLVNKKNGESKVKEFTRTKEQFFDALKVYSKEYRTNLLPLWATGFGIRQCFKHKDSTDPWWHLSACVFLLSLPVGLSIDIAGLPVYAGIKAYRVMYKQLRVKRNIQNLMNNKKFKTIKPTMAFHDTNFGPAKTKMNPNTMILEHYLYFGRLWKSYVKPCRR